MHAAHCWSRRRPSFRPSQYGFESRVGSGSGFAGASLAIASASPHDGDGPVPHVAVPGDEADLGVRDLRGTALAAKLAHELDDVVQARHVRLRQEPAVRVDGQPAAERDRSALDEWAALALPAEPEVLDLGEHGEGEAVVDLG